MGVGVQQWRVAIGTFMMPFKKVLPAVASIQLSRTAVFGVVRVLLLLVLISGDIERNPGPQPKSTAGTTETATNSTFHTCKDETENSVNTQANLRSLEEELADAKVAHGRADLQTADEKYAKCVNIINEWTDGEEKDTKLAEILLNMADIHQQKALDGYVHPGYDTLYDEDKTYWKEEHLEKLSKLMHFRNSAGFLNSALVRMKKSQERVKQIKEKLGNLDKLIVSSIRDVKYSGDSKSLRADEKHREKLTEIRDSIKHLFNDVNLSLFDPSSAPDTEKERNFIEHVENVVCRLNHYMFAFLENIWDHCIQTIGLTPPEHTVVLFGSLGRKEATPFSDIECGVLLKDDTFENRQMIRELVFYMYVKVINLQETILPNLAIPSLKNHVKSFFDSGPRGVKFDAYFPWACKIPLGREPTKLKPWRLEFIGSPEALASLQTQDKSVKESYHVSQVLRNSSYLCGNPQLYDEYRQKVAEYNRSEPCVRKEACDVLTHEIPGKMPDLTLNNHGEKWNAKAEIYRLPSLFITNSAVMNGLQTDSQWQAVRQLTELGCFTPAQSHSVLLMQSIAAYLRLYTYFLYSRQNDDFPLVALFEPGSKALKSGMNVIVPLTLNQMLFQYLNISTPIFKKLKGLTDKQNVKFQESDIFALELPSDIAIAYSHLMWDEKTIEYARAAISNKTGINDITCLLLLSSAYNHLSQYSESNKYLQKAEDIMGNIPCELAASIKQTLGSNYLEMGEVMKAISLFKECLGMKYRIYGLDSCNLDIAYTLNGLALAYSNMCNYPESNKYIQKANDLIGNIPSDGSPNVQVALIKHSLGSHYVATGQAREGISVLKECLRMQYRIYGPDCCHFDIVTTLNSLGYAYCILSNYPESNKYFQKADDMMANIPSDGTPHEMAAKIKNNIGSNYLAMGQVMKAIHVLKQCLSMKYRIYGPDSRNLDIAYTLDCLGSAYGKMSNYTESNKYLQKADDIMQNIPSDGTPHAQAAGIKHNLGANYLEMGHTMEAICVFQECLSMQYRIYGHDSCDAAIARTLNSLGVAYNKMSNYTESNKYFQKADDIIGNTPSDGSPHTLAARIKHNIGSNYLAMDQEMEAISMFNQSLTMKYRIYGPNSCHVEIARTLNRLGVAYSNISNYLESIKYHQKADVMMANIPSDGSTHALAANIKRELGATYLVVGEFDAAMRMFYKCLIMFRTIYGRHTAHPNIALILYYMGITHVIKNFIGFHHSFARR